MIDYPCFTRIPLIELLNETYRYEELNHFRDELYFILQKYLTPSAEQDFADYFTKPIKVESRKRGRPKEKPLTENEEIGIVALTIKKQINNFIEKHAGKSEDLDKDPFDDPLHNATPALLFLRTHKGIESDLIANNKLRLNSHLKPSTRSNKREVINPSYIEILFLMEMEAYLVTRNGKRLINSLMETPDLRTSYIASLKEIITLARATRSSNIAIQELISEYNSHRRKGGLARAEKIKKLKEIVIGRWRKIKAADPKISREAGANQIYKEIKNGQDATTKKLLDRIKEQATRFEIWISEFEKSRA